MHIGLFSPVWPPGAVANGIATYTRIVRDELLRQGHRVTVFSARCETDPSEGVIRVGRGVPRPLFQRLVGRFRRLAARLVGRSESGFEAFGQEVAAAIRTVHAQDPLDVFEMEESFGWCSEVAGHVPMPVVVKLHGPAFLSLMDGQAQSASRRQRVKDEGKALRVADAIVSPSASTLADTLAHYRMDAARAVVVPNPVAESAPSADWVVDARDDEHIVCIGRFDYRKGADLAIHSFLQLAHGRPRLRLTLAGPGAGLSAPDGRLLPPADYLAECVPPGMQSRIQWLGPVDMATVQALRARASVVLVASRWESFGYAVAEAMMQGCPVVALDVPGVNELIAHGQTGLLAPMDDVPALAAHLARVLDDAPLAARLGTSARSAVRENCGASAVVRRMLDHFSQLQRAPRASSTSPTAAAAAGSRTP